jgi:farnesyl diphosphate synthase
VSFSETLTRDAAAIEARLMAALEGRADVPVVEAMRYALRGGKRLRGFLVLEGARMHGLRRAHGDFSGGGSRGAARLFAGA